jgi:F1F0 ATPase subunit 2
MNETLSLASALITGILLGVIFFGGLWWTVQKMVSSQSPALWLFGSLMLRTSIVLAGFYFIARGHWAQMFACLLGFTIARLITMRLIQPTTYLTQEPNHAPYS